MVVVKVTGIATQGRQDYNQWVTQYIVSYSPDSTNFRFYREGKSTKVRVILSIFNLFRVIFTLIKKQQHQLQHYKNTPLRKKKENYTMSQKKTTTKEALIFCRRIASVSLIKGWLPLVHFDFSALSLKMDQCFVKLHYKGG